MNVVNQPITGQEEIVETSSPYSALVNFYSAFNSQNYKQMEKNWLSTTEATMSNPLGGIKLGWNEIKEVYQKIFSGKATVYVEFYDYSIHSTDSMFLAVGRERGILSTNNKPIKLAIRTTRIYVLNRNSWKQIHHHGSIESPELLEIYQTTLLRNK